MEWVMHKPVYRAITYTGSFFLVILAMRRKHDISGTEEHRDGDNKACEVQRQGIVFAAELAQHGFGQLLRTAGLSQEQSEDAAKRQQQSQTGHRPAKTAVNGIGERGQGHAAGNAENHGGKHQGNGCAEFKFDQQRKQNDHCDEKDRNQRSTG